MSMFRIQFFTGFRIPKILLEFRISGIPVASLAINPYAHIVQVQEIYRKRKNLRKKVIKVEVLGSPQPIYL